MPQHGRRHAEIAARWCCCTQSKSRSRRGAAESAAESIEDCQSSFLLSTHDFSAPLRRSQGRARYLQRGTPYSNACRAEAGVRLLVWMAIPRDTSCATSSLALSLA